MADKNLSVNAQEIEDSVSKKHTHVNKAVLDGITQAKVDEWNNAGTGDVTKAYVDNELLKKAQLGHRHDASEIDNLPSGGSTDLTNYYTKTEVDTKDNLKSDKATTYTKTEVDSALSGKSPTTHDHNTLYYDKATVDQKIANVSSGGTVDLTSYQQKTDNTLTTTNKTVVGAINENKSSLDTITTIKYDDIEINGQNLVLKANGNEKKTIIIPSSEGSSINDSTTSTISVWSSSKTLEQISLIPKGDKGDTGSSGTASVAIDDALTNASQTWSSSKIDTVTEMGKYAVKTQVKSKNIFNKNDIRTGGFYDRTTGVWTNNAGFWTSEFIEIAYNNVYKCSSSAYGFSFWDANKTYISGLSGSNSVTIPNNTNIKYIKLQFQNTASKDTFMFAKDVLPTVYEPYSPYDVFLLNKNNFNTELCDYSIASEMLKDNAVTNSKIFGGITPSKVEGIELVVQKTGNYFNKNNVESDGYYKYDTGIWTVGAYCTSNKIKVKSGEKYYLTNCSLSNTFWDINGNYISGANVNPITVPSNASIYYMKVTCLKTNINIAMVTEGVVSPTGGYVEYAPYNVYELPNDKFILNIKDKSIGTNKLDDTLLNEIAVLKNKKVELDIEKRRAKTDLFIETYFEGSNQPMHPDVIEVPSAINGYKYWMAYTPYPFGAIIEENPCICCSKDLIKWETPNGLINPLDKSNLISNTNYLSDTVLLWNEITSKLECWYRGVATNNDICIYRKTSLDGIIWSDREHLLTRSDTNIGLISPSVIRENGIYVIWATSGGGGKYTTSDGTNWIRQGDLTIDGIQLPTNTHFNIKKNTTLNKYEMVYAIEKELFYCNSVDGLNFTNKEILIRNTLPESFDDGKYYRPSWIIKDGIYYFYYSFMAKDWEWGITLSVGTINNDIFSIVGIDGDIKSRMSGITMKPKMGGKTGQITFDGRLNKMVYCQNGGKTAIWKDFSGNIVT